MSGCHTSKSKGDSNSGNNVKEASALLDVPSLEEPKFRSSTNEESLSKPQSCSTSYIDNFKAIPMLDLMNPTSFTFEPNMLQLEYAQCETKPFNGSQPRLPFPQIPQVQTDIPLPLDGQNFTTRLGDPNFLDALGNTSAPKPEANCQGVVKQETDTVINPLSPNSFIDDFPIDMFDHIEPLPSPPDW